MPFRTCASFNSHTISYHEVLCRLTLNHSISIKSTLLVTTYYNYAQWLCRAVYQPFNHVLKGTCISAPCPKEGMLFSKHLKTALAIARKASNYTVHHMTLCVCTLTHMVNSNREGYFIMSTETRLYNCELKTEDKRIALPTTYLFLLLSSMETPRQEAKSCWMEGRGREGTKIPPD